MPSRSLHCRRLAKLRIVADVAERLLSDHGQDGRGAADRRNDTTSRRRDQVGERTVTRLPENGDALAELVADLHITFREGLAQLDGVDVSTEIRAEEIGNRASAIAVHGQVRTALIARQRAFRKPPGLVADGRDMGTVIFPDATLKVFLTASVEARAARRHKQLIQKGFSANMEDLLRDLRERDARDSNRATAPLKPAADAKELDTSGLSVDQAVEQIIGWYKAVRV